ncbi:putative alcohol dehydrogenase [Helianthus annuus]|nr:putative alcohol dehydrogenase [Helianthus annuus]
MPIDYRSRCEHVNKFEKKLGFEFENPKEYKKPVEEFDAEITNGGVYRSVECTSHMISTYESVMMYEFTFIHTLCLFIYICVFYNILW